MDGCPLPRMEGAVANMIFEFGVTYNQQDR